MSEAEKARMLRDLYERSEEAAEKVMTAMMQGAGGLRMTGFEMAIGLLFAAAIAAEIHEVPEPEALFMAFSRVERKMGRRDLVKQLLQKDAEGRAN